MHEPSTWMQHLVNTIQLTEHSGLHLCRPSLPVVIAKQLLGAEYNGPWRCIFLIFDMLKMTFHRCIKRQGWPLKLAFVYFYGEMVYGMSIFKLQPWLTLTSIFWQISIVTTKLSFICVCICGVFICMSVGMSWHVYRR